MALPATPRNCARSSPPNHDATRPRIRLVVGPTRAADDLHCRSAGLTSEDMNAYNGQALVTVDDMEVPVNANLSSYRDGLRPEWGGMLTPTPDGLPQLLNLTKGRLRLADGTEADFLRSDTSDWVSTQRLTIIGQGEAPF